MRAEKTSSKEVKTYRITRKKPQNNSGKMTRTNSSLKLNGEKEVGGGEMGRDFFIYLFFFRTCFANSSSTPSDHSLDL